MTTQPAYAPVDPGIAGLDGDRVKLTLQQLEDFDSHIDGPLIGAGDEAWDDAVLVWNAMVARVPGLVFQPTSAGDVAAAVGFARDHRLLLSIKGGGHNRRRADRERRHIRAVRRAVQHQREGNCKARRPPGRLVQGP